MQQIKIFKTNNKEILITQNKINDWLHRENIKVNTISTINGVSYKNNKESSFDEVEIFIIVLYEK